MITAKTPWKDYMGDVPMNLKYFEGTLFESVNDTAWRYPKNTAFTFMGKDTDYQTLVKDIDACAKALVAVGVQPGDRVTIAMPNCPQAVTMFYAVNLVGAISNMIHPLSAQKEIEFYLNESDSTVAVTLDQFYGKFAAIRENTNLKTLIIASIKDALSPVMKVGYSLTEGRKIEKLPKDAPVLYWKDFLKGRKGQPRVKAPRSSDDPAVILYSGGTTGTTKGIVLTNKNFNAWGQQVIAANPMFRPGDKMLSAMPIFHGFGLGVCIHTMLSQGGHCLIIFFAAKDGEALYSQQKQDQELTVAQIMNSLLPNSDLN